MTAGTDGDVTGTSYVATCDEGYSVTAANPLSGNLVCDSTGTWSNQPVCDGMLSSCVIDHLCTLYSNDFYVLLYSYKYG